MFEIKNALGGVPCDGCNESASKCINVSVGRIYNKKYDFKRLDLCSVCFEKLKKIMSDKPIKSKGLKI
jgi:hypothetical protein